MIARTVVGLVLLGLASANASVVSLILPADAGDYDASIAGGNTVATTYHVHCASGTASTASCQIPDGVTVVQGPTTYISTYTFRGATASVGCSLGGTTTAICTATGSYPATTADGFTMSGEVINNRTTLAASDLTFLPVTVTAGSVTDSASSTNSAPASASASASGKDSSTSTSTGGMPQVTGNARVAVGGAVAFAALAVL